VWALAVAVAMGCGAKSKPAPAPAPVAVAIVYSGWEQWIGNDDYLNEDDPTRVVGALKGIRAALDRAPFAGLPAGSQGTLISYAIQPSVRVPMGPIEQVNGAALGAQKDYYNTMGVELVQGVTLAMGELEKVPGARRHLVVLGDGSDTNPEAARGKLAELRQRSAQLGIEVHALTYLAGDSIPLNLFPVLTPDAVTANTVENIPVALAAIFDKIRAPAAATAP
jgi:hypothetical protein